MSDEPFVATPKPRKRVNITLGELMDALDQYLRHVLKFESSHMARDHNRDPIFGRETIMEFYGAMSAALGRRERVDARIEGVAATSERAKLGGEPIIVYLKSADRSDATFDVVAVPSEDRSIAIHRVKRWEGGAAVY